MFKMFQGHLNGDVCLLDYYKKYVLRLESEAGEAAQKGAHFEYLITDQTPTRGSELYKMRTIEGKLKKNGDPYSGWSHISECAENFKDFCKGKSISWIGGKTHTFVDNGTRHKIITDIEAVYNNKPLIIDLKFTSSLVVNIKKEWSWKVDKWTTASEMLNNGFKIWQALYYCAFMLISTGKKYDFVFYVQSSSEANKLYIPYFLEFSVDELLQFWNQINELIKKEQETISMFDELSFVGDYKHCVNCDFIDNCNSKNLVGEFVYIDK